MSTVLVPLSELVKPTRPKVKPADFPEMPFLGMEHVEPHTMRILGSVPAGSMKSAGVRFEPGDVLYGRLRPYLNKVARPNFAGICSAEFIVLPENGLLSGPYLQYLLNSAEFVSFAGHLDAGDRPRVDFGQIGAYLVPLVPPDKQRQVVAEIEKQFSRLDEAVANLRRVKGNAVRYAKAILNAATDGTLWVGPESGSGGENLSAASCWTRAMLGDVAVVLDPNPSHRMPAYVERGIPLISSENFIGADGIDFSKGKQVGAETLAKQRALFAIEDGDFVLSRIGTIGKTRLLPLGRDYCLSHALVVVKVLDPLVDKHWLRYAISSDRVLHQARSGVQSVGVPDLGMGKIRAFEIRIPPLEEQRRIVAEVDRRLSIIRGIEAQVETNLKRAHALRQAVLAKAFGGATEPLSEENAA